VSARCVGDETSKHASVILAVKEYERMVEELEELEAVLAYKEAKTSLERGEDEAIPLDQAVSKIWEGKVTGDK
jgi:PHD/YefM family antitoxin component YafN of YafNO toxin-antitoxin module